MQIKDIPYSDRLVIEKARNILERYANAEALSFAEQNEIKPNLQNIVYYGAYLDGARATLNRLRADARGKINLSGVKGAEGAIYDDAILQLIAIDKHHTNMYLERRYEIQFRNHQRNKKGRLTSVEAYFAKVIHRVVEAE